MKAPSNFREITVEKYKELISLKPEDFESTFDFRLERLSIILDEDAEELGEKLTVEELTDLTKKTAWINKRIKGEFIENFCVFEFKKFELLTLGEFIDLENYFENGYYLNIEKILSILYRKTSIDEYRNKFFEPYRFDIEERKNEFLNFSILNAQYVIDSYLRYREFFISKRKTLFKDEESEEIEEEENEPKTREEIEEEKKEKIFERWSWEFLIWKICKGDLTKIEQVTELNLILVFNFEAMKKELNVKEF